MGAFTAPMAPTVRCGSAGARPRLHVGPNCPPFPVSGLAALQIALVDLLAQQAAADRADNRREGAIAAAPREFVTEQAAGSCADYETGGAIVAAAIIAAIVPAPNAVITAEPVRTHITPVAIVNGHSLGGAIAIAIIVMMMTGHRRARKHQGRGGKRQDQHLHDILLDALVSQGFYRRETKHRADCLNPCFHNVTNRVSFAVSTIGFPNQLVALLAGAAAPPAPGLAVCLMAAGCALSTVPAPVVSAGIVGPVSPARQITAITRTMPSTIHIQVNVLRRCIDVWAIGVSFAKWRDRSRCRATRGQRIAGGLVPVAGRFRAAPPRLVECALARSFRGFAIALGATLLLGGGLELPAGGVDIAAARRAHRRGNSRFEHDLGK